MEIRCGVASQPVDDRPSIEEKSWPKAFSVALQKLNAFS